ncbi:MAG: CoA transferase [Dehalococcoidia bacterium]|nr:CoA transferase [Dehalococcoidia bacterium]
MTFSLLQGLRVVELGESVSAPYCTKLLADMGAEVVKIERPGVGDQAREYGPFLNDEPHHERSGLFLYLNSNKQGITLDLDTPTGREILGELLAESQVFVHNLHPTEMDRLGVNYGTLKSHNDHLVMASITPFGLTGPYRHYKAYDINLAAAGGICEGLGSPDREPLTFGTPEVGYFAAMAAASSVVIALLAGQGQHIDIAEVESMAGIYNGPEALMAVYQWRMTRRTGHHALDFPYPNCILRCKDGYIFVGSPEGRQWRTLLEVMGQPEWAKEDRFRNRTAMNNEYADEVDGYMEEWLLRYTKAELLALALEHRIPLAPVRDFKEVRNDESLTDQFVAIDRTDTGPVFFPGSPYSLSAQEVVLPRPAPLLGQHNADIYCGRLGYSKEELVKLYQVGII